MSTWSAADVRRAMYLLALLAIVVGCTAALVLAKPNDWEKVGLQTVAVVGGAALGNALKADQSRALIQQQAAGAIRRLIEQATRLGRQVEMLERHRDEVGSAGGGTFIDATRVADWFDASAEGLRVEIDATASAIEDWGALAHEVQEREVERFKTRRHRLGVSDATANAETQEGK